VGEKQQADEDDYVSTEFREYCMYWYQFSNTDPDDDLKFQVILIFLSDTRSSKTLGIVTLVWTAQFPGV
jgi:hypothetical protein